MSRWIAAFWALGLGCGGGGEASTPESALAAVQAAYVREDWAGSWELLAPSWKTKQELVWATLRKSEDPASYRELYLRHVEQNPETARSVAAATPGPREKRGEREAFPLKHGEWELVLEFILEDGRWYLAGPPEGEPRLRAVPARRED